MKMNSTTITYRVPYADTDQMGFVYYANYLVMFERARNEQMRQMGLPYREMEAMGQGMPVVEARVKYHRPAKYDDVVRIEAQCTWNGGARLTVEYKVYRDDELLAEGTTTHAFMSLKTGRPERPCQAFVDKFKD